MYDIYFFLVRGSKIVVEQVKEFSTPASVIHHLLTSSIEVSPPLAAHTDRAVEHLLKWDGRRGPTISRWWLAGTPCRFTSHSHHDRSFTPVCHPRLPRHGLRSAAAGGAAGSRNFASTVQHHTLLSVVRRAACRPPRVRPRSILVISLSSSLSLWSVFLCAGSWRR